MRIRNPYRDDPRFAHLFERARKNEWPHRCRACGATWVGPVDDDQCGWCEDRAAYMEASRIAELLYPSWMTSEGPRFDELSGIDQKIWNQTRDRDIGTYGPHDWLDGLYAAMHEGVISESQAVAALGRVLKWQRNST